jgi:uncharacterized RDD family membrane protein YckC
MKQRHFHAHETARFDELDGLPLAGFRRRVLGFSIDFFLMLIVWASVSLSWILFVARHTKGHTNVDLDWHPHDLRSLIFLFVYAALACYWGNGKTPGKWIARTRVVSLTHSRMGLWQSLERALGYGASFLEGGFGFLQYFIHRNRQTVHDRIAETIVVDESKKATRLLKVEVEEPEAATDSHPVRAVLDGDLGEGDASGSGVARS